MNKKEFLARLRESLSDSSQEDVEERLSFYSEMIDDRIEEGFSETEAVSELLSMDEIGTKIIAEIPLKKQKRRRRKTKLKTWEIVLLAVGSPIWLSLLLAVFVVLAFYISLWAVVVSLWAAFVALIATAFACILLTLIYFCVGNALMGVTMLSAASILMGLSIFLFFGCKAATKISYVLPKIIFSRLKKRFKKENKL